MAKPETIKKLLDLEAKLGISWGDDNAWKNRLRTSSEKTVLKRIAALRSRERNEKQFKKFIVKTVLDELFAAKESGK